VNAAAATAPPDSPLASLLAGFVGGEVPNVNISNVAMDSRRVQPGGLFLACHGERHHGLEYLFQALANGAAAVAFEPAEGLAAPAPDTVGVPLIAVSELRARAGLIADRFYRSPSEALTVTGVTGTNGKTTVTWLLASVSEQLGQPCGLLGTLGTGRPGALQASTLTTPDAVEVHRSLAQLVREGAEASAMEVSSHALVQSRVAGVRFDAGVFTNLSRDHLDYHGDMASYAEAKARLFTEHAPALAVINTADPWGARIAARLGSSTRLITVGTEAAASPVPADAEHIELRDVAIEQAGLTIRVGGTFGHAQLTSPLLGRFNADNLALVLGVLLGRGVPLESACNALARCTPPAGRMQQLGGGQSLPRVIVDYAHTPDALAKALEALREHGDGRLLCVFGCGGERDRGKRAQMGEVADRLADIVVVTDDNPRGEDPAAIVADVLGGIRRAADLHVEHDRRRAIGQAIAMAAPGDTVLIAGKGHEAYQLRGGERTVFSDSEAAAAALASGRAGAGGAR
jgi:UDP-N-acetylmuramoyl-L-alanyl-D-glutamate--2,6-diaminopimelate ligase